jgi:hypothetical protein
MYTRDEINQLMSEIVAKRTESDASAIERHTSAVLLSIEVLLDIREEMRELNSSMPIDGRLPSNNDIP